MVFGTGGAVGFYDSQAGRSAASVLGLGGAEHFTRSTALAAAIAVASGSRQDRCK